MARLPRVVLPGIPHHVTQRGNRRGRTFFEDGDYELYLGLLADAAERARCQIWSYCLMPNHVRSEEHTSELQSLMRISYAVFCLKKKNRINKKELTTTKTTTQTININRRMDKPL